MGPSHVDIRAAPELMVKSNNWWCEWPKRIQIGATIALWAPWRTLAKLSDQTVGKILQRNGIPPAPERQRTTTWTDFIRAHMSVLAGTDFFSVEVLMLRGLVTYYVLFFIHLESRRVEIAGITRHPKAMKPG
jgi:hypothetical protein